MTCLYLLGLIIALQSQHSGLVVEVLRALNPNEELFQLAGLGVDLTPYRTLLFQRPIDYRWCEENEEYVSLEAFMTELRSISNAFRSLYS